MIEAILGVIHEGWCTCVQLLLFAPILAMTIPSSKVVDATEKIGSHGDIESLQQCGNPIDKTTGEGKLVRQLKNRHIAMIR